MSNGINGLFGQLQSAVSTISQQLQTQAPAQQPQLPTMPQFAEQFQPFADQFQQALGNPQLLNQLGIPTPAALTPLDTPQKVSTAYKAAALRDLTDPKTIAKLNDELKAQGKPPVTSAEVAKMIQNTDVKALSPRDYETLKLATGGSTDNPATTLDAANRAKIAESGPERLATARNGGQKPSESQIAAAKKELERIDPDIFKAGAKDVVYVNERHVGANGDPRQTKVAAHEFVHVVLNNQGVPHESNGVDVHHDITGRFGWNQKPGPGGANRNWNTPPGKGLPPD
ncbi:MAG: hypothetical protein JNK82_45025 [Myxococcaceae bacterium]|nr:hypothetical protein [Myxococcaceae bacterium]